MTPLVPTMYYILPSNSPMTTDLSFLLLSSDKRSDDKVEFALDFPAGMGPFICGPGNRSLKAVSRGSGATCTCKYLPYPTLPYPNSPLLFLLCSRYPYIFVQASTRAMIWQ